MSAGRRRLPGRLPRALPRGLPRPRVRTGWVGLGVAALAAMALGRVITEQVPVDEVVPDPFVHRAEVGETVALRYVDAEVTRVRVTPSLYGSDAVAAGGRFVVVDLELSARQESTSMLGFHLLDAEGRRFSPTSRGATCATNTTVPTGLTWYAMFCFDVPRDALAGLRMVVAKGDYGVLGSGLRRDDLAEVDLGIEADEVEGLWAGEVGYETEFPGLLPLESDEVAPPADEEGTS